MANNFDLQAFFANMEGKTWSLGSAFKRANPLPLDATSLWQTKVEADDYALSPTAYPGQIVAVVEKKDNLDTIKLYYIDENRVLQEVGSATLGDNKTIVLDPNSKILSIKGFEEAGFAKTNDEAVQENKTYFTFANGVYTAVVEPAADPKLAEYYERIAVKLIKDSAGNLAWITDDAVQIQGNIAALQSTVDEHAEKIAKNAKAIKDLEDKHDVDIEAVNTRITSLGTVFNFVGSLTVTELETTVNEGIIVDKNGVRLDRPYRVGDVILVEGKEYVATKNAEDKLVWEAFGDPQGIETLQKAVEQLQKDGSDFDERLDDHEDRITDLEEAVELLNNEETVTGSVKHTAKSYADIAEANAKNYVDGDFTTAIIDPIVEDIGDLAEDVETNTSDIAEIGLVLDGNPDATDSKVKIGLIGRVNDLETKSATKTELQGVANDLISLGNNLTNNYYTKAQIDDETTGYAKKEALAALTSTVDDIDERVIENTDDIKAIYTEITGHADGHKPAAEGSMLKNIEKLQTATSDNATDIAGLKSRLDKVDAATTGTVAVAQARADEAYGLADEANTLADTANKTAKAALPKSGGNMSGDINMDSHKVTGLATPTADADAATKAYVDNKTKAVSDLIGDKDTAGTVYNAIAAAQSKADEAFANANENAEDIVDIVKDIDDITKKFNDYYTSSSIDTKLADIVGTDSDTENSNTIKGAKKYAASVADKVASDLDKLQGDLRNITNVMNFIGKATEDPLEVEDPNGAISITDQADKHTPDKGDVIIYGEFEYVYTGSAWEIFGNVTADSARLADIEAAIGTKDGNSFVAGSIGILKDIKDLQDADDNLNQAIETNSSNIGDLEDAVDSINTALDTPTTGIKAVLATTKELAEAAATKLALEAEVKRATDKETELANTITSNQEGQASINGELRDAISAITDATNGLLAWETF